VRIAEAQREARELSKKLDTAHDNVDSARTTINDELAPLLDMLHPSLAKRVRGALEELDRELDAISDVVVALDELAEAAPEEGGES
jgi:uncharacterized protein YPO0396